MNQYLLTQTPPQPPYSVLPDWQMGIREDGNRDGIVDADDLAQFNYWANLANPANPANLTGVPSSWFDFNLDAAANSVDVPYITQGKFPRKCPKSNLV